MRKTRTQSTIPQRIRLYEAGKLIYDESPHLSPQDLLERAQKLVPKALRPTEYPGLSYMLMGWLKETQAKAESRIQWQPHEWSIVIREYERLLAENHHRGRGYRNDLSGRAMQLLPKSRQKPLKTSPNVPGEIDRTLIEIGPRVTLPTKENPFPNAPKTTQAAEPEAPREQPREAQEPAANGVDELGGMIFNMLGVAFNAAIEKAAAIIGERIGESVAKSVGEALYQMRMGILSSKRETPNTQAPASVTPIKPANELPENLRTPKVLLIGMESGREQLIKREFPRIDFRFCRKDMPGATIKSVAENCDASYVMIKFVGHTVTDALRKANGGPGYSPINGGFDALRIRITDDFPAFSPHRDKVRQSAAFAAH